jgi:hypothetical protein
MAENVPVPGQLPDPSQPQQQQPTPPTSVNKQPQQNQQKQPKPVSAPQIKRRVVIPRKGPVPLKSGELFVGKYAFWKHDPTPLVLFSKQYQDGRLAGLNLHRITLNDMRNLISQYCNKTFDYQSIKGRKNISQAYRSYRQDGFGMVQVFNCEYFLTSLGIVKQSRDITPNEVEKLRQQIQQQLKQQVVPKANELAKKPQAPTGTIPGKPASVPGTPIGGQQQGTE